MMSASDANDLYYSRSVVRSLSDIPHYFTRMKRLSSWSMMYCAVAA
jgi:hypothetical protein